MRKINFFTHAILRTLPRRFCAPFLFTLHYYLRMLWWTYAHKSIWLYYSINFLPPQTYLATHVTNSRFQNYEQLIQNLWTFDTKPTNYQSFLLQTADFKITNYQSFLIQSQFQILQTSYQSFLLVLTRSKDCRWCWEKDSLSLNCQYQQNEKS